VRGAENDDPFVDDGVQPAGFAAAAAPNSAEVRAAFAASIDEVRRSGVLQTALGVGDRAVDFELPHANGTNLRLSELLAVGPVVLVYYRGNWCPFCNRHLQGLQRALSDIHSLDAQLIAVSPETSAHGLATQVKDGLAYPTLTDQDNVVARRYGIVYRLSREVIPFYEQYFDAADYYGNQSHELPLAATYVIDSDGVIRYAFVDADFTERADPQAILEVLRRLKRSSPARPTTQPLARR
jgi:peroxiredoxin